MTVSFTWFLIFLALTSLIGSFVGASISMIIFGKRMSRDGIHEYLDRKEEELNQKIKRTTF